MLAAQYKGPQPVRLQPGPVPMKISRDDEGKSEEMGEAEHIEIGLVDRIDHLDQPLRNQRSQVRAMPCHHDDEREENPGNRDRENNERPEQPFELGTRSAPAPGGEEEQHLPRKRIEIPG